jgi:thiamine pyrophosphate-dependent acetolactate synthase large subunit-like protein
MIQLAYTFGPTKLLKAESTSLFQVGRGGFQELDQLAIVKPFVKYAGRADNVRTVPKTLQSAVSAAAAGRPGAAYVDVPAGRCFSDLV